MSFVPAIDATVLRLEGIQGGAEILFCLPVVGFNPIRMLRPIDFASLAYLIGNVLRSVSGRSLQEQVDVIGRYFEGRDLAVQLFRLAENQRSQARLDAPGEHLPPVFRTPHEVASHRRNAAAKVAIPFGAHYFNYSPVFDNWRQTSARNRRPGRSPRYPSAWLKSAVSRAETL